MEDLISTQAARKHATLAASVSLAGLYVAPSDVRHRQVKFSSKWHARLRWREGRGFVRAWDKDRAPRSRADGTPFAAQIFAIVDAIYMTDLHLQEITNWFY